MSIMGKLDFPKVTVNNSIHPFYDDFDFRSASFPFERHTKENAFSPLVVTGKLDFPKVAGNSWNHLFYDDFYVCTTFSKF